MGQSIRPEDGNTAAAFVNILANEDGESIKSFHKMVTCRYGKLRYVGLLCSFRY
jgi:hypothetical protein